MDVVEQQKKAKQHPTHVLCSMVAKELDGVDDFRIVNDDQIIRLFLPNQINFPVVLSKMKKCPQLLETMFHFTKFDLTPLRSATRYWPSTWTFRLRSLENSIPPVVLRVTAID